MRGEPNPGSGAAGSNEGSAESAGASAQKRKGFWEALRGAQWSVLGHGLVITAPLMLLSLWLEGGPAGSFLSLFLYELRGTTLGSRAEDVVLVDITGINQTIGEDGRANVSRETLETLLTDLSGRGPHVIGIDLDLAPGPGAEPLDPKDHDLLCFAKRNGVPIVVGVFRDVPDPWTVRCPDTEQGKPLDASSLAGHLAVADASLRVVPAWIQGARGPAIPGLAAAMRRTQGPLLMPDDYPDLLATAAVRPEGDPHSVAGPYYLVDCSSVPLLARDKRVQVSFVPPPPGGTKWKCEFPDEMPELKDKYILVGAADPEKAKDNSFHVPPDFRRNYPGIYMHACAVDTLLKGYLYRPTHVMNVLLDLMAALTVFGTFVILSASIGWACNAPLGKELELGLKIAVTLTVIAGAVCCGMILISSTRLLWDGFVFVSLALLLHLALEHPVHRLFQWAGKWIWIVYAVAALCGRSAFFWAGAHERDDDSHLVHLPAPIPGASDAPITPPPIVRMGGLERGGAHATAGRQALDGGDWPKAIERLRLALREDKGDWALRLDLSRALLGRGSDDDLAQAVEACREAAELEPRQWRCPYNLACAHALRGEFDDALAALRKAIELDAGAREIARTDQDLVELRKDPRAAELLGER